MKKIRAIDSRCKPPVKGIDLWQSMNFIDMNDVSRRFIYDCYTSSTICYVRGSRPELENSVTGICRRIQDPFERVVSLTRYVSETARWAGYYEAEKGKRLRANRNLTEEQILDSGFGWCNEQARVLCALTQIAGIPSRLVFGSNSKNGYGHVVTEVLTPIGWLLVDQSLGFCFIKKKRPANAWEVSHTAFIARYFEPVYRSLCQDLGQKLGIEILTRDFKMAVVENPLKGFESLGYCNCFV